jgi:protein subunit release factor A
MSKDEQLRGKVRAALERRDELGQQLADPAVIGDPEKLRQVAQEHAGLEEIGRAGAELLKLS